MSFVKMPQDDYVAMCNKLRSMLNETDKYTSKDFIEKMDELILPNLDEMDFGSNSSLPEKGNTNPEYYEDIAKAINEIKQADAVVLEELNVTESKKYTAPSGIAYSSVNVDIEEGGNPNYVETIKGTLANPWGGRFSEIYNMLADSNNYTVYMSAYGNKAALVLDYSVVYWSLWFDDIDAGTPSTATVYTIAYNKNGGMDSARYLQGTSWSSLQSTEKTVITIIHHPMPESGS